MRRLVQLAVLFLLASVPTLGQNTRFDSIAYRFSAGFPNYPAAGAVITVCTSTGVGQPCTPLAAICASASDTICTNANPFNADAFGNFGFWVPPGVYVVTITGANTTGFTLTITAPVQPSSNGTAPPSLTLSSLTVSPGPVVAAKIGPSSGQQHTLPAVTSDTFALLNATQTVLNKTLTGASNGNTVTLLNAQANAGAITGTGSAVTVYTYTLPANTVANLKGIRVRAGINHSTGSASVVYNLTLNGVSVTGGTFSNTATGAISVNATVLNTGATAGTADIQNFYNGGTLQEINGVLSSLAWTSSQVLTLTFNVAASDQVTPVQFLVELIQ